MKTIWIDGECFYKLDGETDDQCVARHKKIKEQQDAMHGPGWKDNYLARKHRELGTLN